MRHDRGGRDVARRRPARAFPWQERRGLRVYRHALEREALLRPIGNTVYFMPPYVITPDEIDSLVATARAGHRGCDMRLNRVYSDQPLVAGRTIALPDAAADHVSRVLRLRAGAPLVVFDGSGADYRCEIAAIESDRVTVIVGERSAGLRDSPLRITLVQAVSRSERMDWTLQKATELGVRCIVPVLSARSVVRLDERQAERKLRHWQSIVAGACEQCGRSTLPEVAGPARSRPFPRRFAARGSSGWC